MKNVKNVKVKASLLIMGVTIVVAIFGILVSKSYAAYTKSILKNDLVVMTTGSFGGGVTTGVDPGVTNGLIVHSGKAGIGTDSPAATLAVGGTGSASSGIYGIGSTVGVYGEATTGSGAGIYGGNNGTGAGVQGGQSGSGSGVAGYNTGTGPGVYGWAASNPGVRGVTTYGGEGGVLGEGHDIGVRGVASYANSAGVYGYSSGSTGTGVYGSGSTQGVKGDGGTYGGVFSGTAYGLYANVCYGCSVLAEMIPVSETPNNGDIMCTNPNTGKTEICRADKSSYLKGVAQKYAETVMRMGCEKTRASKSPENSMRIGVMDVDAWQKLPECKGWYPIALSGLSEKTNVVCETPTGKRLGYGDILVSSNIPGRLRPLDKDEAVQSYQIAGRVDTLCAAGKKTDSIMVWIQ